MSRISCSNNKYRGNKGTRYDCFRKGVGIGLSQPVDKSYRDRYSPIDKRKVYCGKARRLPQKYDIMGNLPMCLQKGVGVGKTMKARRRSGAKKSRMPTSVVRRVPSRRRVVRRKSIRKPRVKSVVRRVPSRRRVVVRKKSRMLRDYYNYNNCRPCSSRRKSNRIQYRNREKMGEYIGKNYSLPEGREMRKRCNPFGAGQVRERKLPDSRLEQRRRSSEMWNEINLDRLLGDEPPYIHKGELRPERTLSSCYSYDESCPMSSPSGLNFDGGEDGGEYGRVELTDIADNRNYNVIIKNLAGDIITMDTYPGDISINELREDVVEKNINNPSVSKYVIRNGVLAYEGKEISNPQRSLAEWADRYGFGLDLEFQLMPHNMEIIIQGLNNFIQNNFRRFKRNVIREFRINRRIRTRTRWSVFCEYMFYMVTDENGRILAQWDVPGVSNLPFFTRPVAEFLGTSLEELRGEEGDLSEFDLLNKRYEYMEMVNRLCKHPRFRNMIAYNLQVLMEPVVEEYVTNRMPKEEIDQLKWWNYKLGRGYWP